MKRTSIMLRHRCSILLFLLLTCLSLPGSLVHAQDRLISYQGSITSSVGKPISGEHILTITLYSDSQGEHPVWSGSYQQLLTNGIFNVTLGSGRYPISAAHDLSKPLWVGVRLDQGEELKPYTQLTGSPYSLSIPDKSVTKAKMGTEYVGSISINGQKVTEKGSDLNIEVGGGINALFNEATNSLLLSGSIKGQKEQAFVFNGCGGNFDGAPGVLTNFVGGGAGNNPNAPGVGCVGGFAAIVGGQANTANVGWAVVGGGVSNTIAGTHSTIGGGNTNTIHPSHSFIGGGWQNIIMGTEDHRLAVIGGGSANVTDGFAAAIIGGGSNHAFSDFATIGGGDFNLIEPLATMSFIGGGRLNRIGYEANFGTIAGGEENIIFPGSVEDLAHHNTIGGGGENHIDVGTLADGSHFGVHNATISGGDINRIFNNFSTIAGGSNNEIRGGTSVISGGGFNFISGPSTANLSAPVSDFSTISGGVLNTTEGFNNTIVGGVENIAVLAEQTIAGYINSTAHNYGGFPSTLLQAGLAAFPPTVANAITPSALSSAYDAPLLAIGNGQGSFFNRVAPHNAFEVSFNGHSVVYDINGTGQRDMNALATQGRPAIAGATYEDNIVYAWGDIEWDGSIISDFGVYRTQVIACQCPCPNQYYLIVLNQVHPDNKNLQRVFTDGSVTATLRAPIIQPYNGQSFVMCDLSISASPLFAFTDPTDGQIHTAFEVFISTPNTPNPNCEATCVSASSPFMFKVTGRRKIADPINEEQGL